MKVHLDVLIILYVFDLILYSRKTKEKLILSKKKKNNNLIILLFIIYYL